MKVALQVDQLWFRQPGGIGTYVRELAEALAAMGALDLSLFHCRFTEAGRTPRGSDGFAIEEVPGPIRTLYPQWYLLGRPQAPARVRGVRRGARHESRRRATGPQGHRRWW